MKLNKIVSMILIGASIVALTACSTARKRTCNPSAYACGAEPCAPCAPCAQTSGIGSGASFEGMGGPHIGGRKNVYYFDFDSDVVHPDDQPAIFSNAHRLASTHGHGLLEGHTDPRGSREYNVGLGERRARSVANMMHGRGVHPSQVRIVSYGSERPAVPGRSEADYALDRRVVLLNRR